MKYAELLRMIGIPLNAIKGGQVAVVETNYLAGLWDSARFPLSFVKDRLADAVGNYALVIAETANHPWRSYLVSETASIAHRARVPKVDKNSVPVLGVYGSIFDADDKTVLTEKPLEKVELIVRMKTANSLTADFYHYQRVSTMLYHTRENVVMECCVFDRDAERAKLDDEDGVCLLPDVLSAGLVAETLGMMVQSDEFLAQAQSFAVVSENVKAQIRQGLTSVLSDLQGQGGQ